MGLSRRGCKTQLARAVMALHTHNYRFSIIAKCRSADAPNGRCVVRSQAIMGQTQL